MHTFWLLTDQLRAVLAASVPGIFVLPSVLKSNAGWSEMAVGSMKMMLVACSRRASLLAVDSSALRSTGTGIPFLLLDMCLYFVHGDITFAFCFLVYGVDCQGLWCALT